MLRFAERTGLTSSLAPRRYLWTDAFAVCNFLGLARTLGKPRFGELAADLIAQVHHVLGRFRPDDPRAGWISGLDDLAGEEHPTIGGLRIGKPFPERPAGEHVDERLEWERDGQYFHYLTKWMVALERFARVTFNEQTLLWARELAATAHRAFTVAPDRMVWKLSTDRSRALVGSMGQHDPLDGLVTCIELDAAARALGMPLEPTLDPAIADYRNMIDRLATADPLGVGGLLVDAARLAALGSPLFFDEILLAAADGLELYVALRELRQPASRRLAFRELGLAIGLAAAERIDRERLSPVARDACARIARHANLRTAIETFWLSPEHRDAASWSDHADINDVMLATSLCPEGMLDHPGA